MLASPSPDDALRQYIAELTISHRASGGADGRYLEQAAAATKRDAAKSVAAWRAEWGVDAPAPAADGGEGKGGEGKGGEAAAVQPAVQVAVPVVTGMPIAASA